MVRLLLASQAHEDLVRLEEFLWQARDPLAADLLDFLLDGLNVLTHQPGVGRPLAQGQRELIISRGRGGYLARYVYDLAHQRVIVLGIRHQREAGYTDTEM
ncbi:MAG: type II toxin-antitoxin system RelE/ParE family toxin [Acidovorax sp.]|uniref:type II toxin-antitoxin system RelE/ParE family toxin n=1 Tax=Acidovorax sp. TaxID=1872122 RepID=UPI0039E6CCC2